MGEYFDVGSNVFSLDQGVSQCELLGRHHHLTIHSVVSVGLASVLVSLLMLMLHGGGC